MQQTSSRSQGIYSSYAKQRTFLRGLHPILPHIPGTRAFKSRVLNDINSVALKKLNAFKALRSLSGREKEDLFPIILSNERIFARTIAFEDLSLAMWVLALIMITISIYSLDIVELIRPKQEYTVSFADYISTVFGALSALFLITSMVFWSSARIPNLNSAIEIPIFTLIVFLPSLLLYILIPQLQLILAGNIINSIFVGVLWSCVVSWIFIILLGLASGASSLYDRYLRSNYPNAVIVRNLVNVLYQLENNTDSWIMLTTKQSILREMEEAALCFQYSIPRKLRTGDIATDEWTSLFFTRIAMTVRSFERSIITPGPTTQQWVAGQMAPILVCALRGEWGQIHCDYFAEVTKPQKLYLRVVSILRHLISGFLPLVLYLLAKRLNPDIVTGSLSDVMAIGAILWGFVSVYAAMDPLFVTKVTTLKDLGGLSPFGKDR